MPDLRLQAVSLIAGLSFEVQTTCVTYMFAGALCQRPRPLPCCKSVNTNAGRDLPRWITPSDLAPMLGPVKMATLAADEQHPQASSSASQYR